MDFYPTIWDVLHDGSIVGTSGTVPGTVRLDVSIEYLRERIVEPGETIQVTLISCTRFAYREYGAQDFTTDLSTIADLEPEFLSAELVDGLCTVHCADGILEVAAADGALKLDTGRGVALSELIEVANAYWNERS